MEKKRFFFNACHLFNLRLTRRSEDGHLSENASKECWDIRSSLLRQEHGSLGLNYLRVKFSALPCRIQRYEGHEETKFCRDFFFLTTRSN